MRSPLTGAASSSALGFSRYTNPDWFEGYSYYYQRGIRISDNKAFLNDLGVSHEISISGAQNGDKWAWHLTGPKGEPYHGLTLTYYDTFSYSGQTYSKCFIYTRNYDAEYDPLHLNGQLQSGYCGLNNFPVAGVGYHTLCSVLGNFNLKLNGVSYPIELVTAGSNARMLLNEDIAQFLVSGLQNLVHIGPISPINVPVAGVIALPGIGSIPLPATGVAGPRAVAEINPKIVELDPAKNQEPGVADVTALVSDSGCPNFPIPDAEVDIKSMTVAKSGGHDHMKERPGFGTFKVISTNTSIKAKNEGALVTGTTDKKGLITGVTYTAGQMGLQENIMAKAITPGPDSQTVNGQSLLITRIPELRNLGSSPFSVLVGQVQGNHTDNHYGTAEMNRRVRLFTEMWNVEKTRRGKLTSPYAGSLNLNDMSLAYGGLFDHKIAFTPGEHFSHRTGIDVDINQLDTLGKSIRPVDLLVKIAKRLGGHPADEEKIHFRFDKPMLSTVGENL